MRNIFFSQWQLCTATPAYTEEMFCAGAAQTATVILAIVVHNLQHLIRQSIVLAYHII